MIDKLSIDHAVSILRKYHENAEKRKNEKAKKEIKSIMQVMQDLYKIAKKHGEVKDAN
jgi:hypothetical protein